MFKMLVTSNVYIYIYNSFPLFKNILDICRYLLVSGSQSPIFNLHTSTVSIGIFREIPEKTYACLVCFAFNIIQRRESFSF